MEATSARMAQRYQFDGFPPPKSTLQRYIYNACDPVSNFEPNLALNLEIVDMINAKKGSSPREAAVTTVQIINHRNPNVSLLALALLDICVKNCGYPYHLQISTKEFLNELVRRFPERPPLRPSRVQAKILEALEEWRQTICQTSRYKEDLGYIRDMHRLLLYKGYMFPEVRREDAAVLNPSDNLKSAEEMEEEEKAAQSAKLQELIRRGTPADLQEANRLMKVMAGYDTRNKTDYRAKAAEEVAKVQQKARLLEEMLQNHKEGESIGSGDVFEELVGALQSAHPKIQKMCEEESDDAEAVNKLLEINDSIHRTIERYKLMKAGNVEAANNIPKGTLGTTTGVGRNANNQLSLIDFDLDEEQPTSEAASGSNGQPQQTSVEDDLLGLSLGGDTQTSGGGISLGGPLLSSLYAQSTTPAPPPLMPAQTPSAIPPSISSPPPATSSAPNYSAFASISTPLSSSKPATPTPMQPQQQHTARPASQSFDPFAALVSSGSRPSTPSAQQNGQRAASGTHQPSNLIALAASNQPPAATADDEWTFSSSLPPEAAASSSLPETNTILVHQSAVKVEFEARRSTQPNATNSIYIQAYFSNTTPTPITSLHFQVAVEKSYTLQLRPQSGRDLSPNASRSVRQEILLSNVPMGKGSAAKLRFKIGYNLNGQLKEEQGMVPGLGIS